MQTFCEKLELAQLYIIHTHFFISNARLKLAKNQANAKQHSENERLLFENYIRLLHLRYYSEIIVYILKIKQKEEVCLTK